MYVVDWRPVAAPAVSLACAGLVFLVGRSVFWRRFWSLSAGVIKLAIILSMLPGALRGVVYTTNLVTLTPGISLDFHVDALGMFFSLVSGSLWILTTIYAIGYMEGDHARVRFFGFFALCVSTTVGIAYAGNLLTLFVFYEMLTICTYPLVIHEETPQAFAAGRKYLVYTLSGGAVLLFSIAMTFYLSGTLTLDNTGILSMKHGLGTLNLLFALYIIGFGVKAAIIPLHSWLPSAMVAPTPVTALLHAVAVVKAGAFGIQRVIYNVFGVSVMRQMAGPEVLTYVAAFTIIAGSLMALVQDNLKKRLAYSTVSQMSYIVLGAALLTPYAAVASILHIANQAFQKITLFFVAGAIERTTGKRNISEMQGIGHQMPVTMACFTVASLGMIGIPLLAGFITKWYLCLGALQAGRWIFVGVILVSALLNASYWLPIIYIAYFKEPLEGPVEVKEARATLLYPAVICALYVVALGTFAYVPGLPVSLALAAVKYVFGM